MDKAHVNTQFDGLVARNWQPVELDALTASVWESPVTDAERKLSQECDNYNEGTSWNLTNNGENCAYFNSPDMGNCICPQCTLETRKRAENSSNGRRNGKPRDKRVTFLPVFRYLRGEFDA